MAINNRWISRLVSQFLTTYREFRSGETERDFPAASPRPEMVSSYNKVQQKVENAQLLSPNFRSYLCLYQELHSIVARGEHASVSNRRRFQFGLDDLRNRLDPREFRLARGLAKDLHALLDPAPREQQVGQDEEAETCRLIEAAWTNKDWIRVIELLREEPLPYPASQVALMRADCWSNLGEPRTSRLFLEKALVDRVRWIEN